MIYGGTERNDDDGAIDASALAFEWNADDRDEAWLVSYADIISTVLAMVVLLFGRNALTATAPTQSTAPPPVVAAPLPVPVALPRVAPAPPATEHPSTSREDQLAALVTARFDGRIRAEQRTEGLVLTIPEVALFPSARAALQDSARPLLDELAATLREVGDTQLSIEGHTDDRPVQGGAFESNWDLAAARANAVTRYFLDRGFAPQRLHSVSFADTRPVADNASPEGRAANRRVELKVEFVAAASY